MRDISSNFESLHPGAGKDMDAVGAQTAGSEDPQHAAGKEPPPTGAPQSEWSMYLALC